VKITIAQRDLEAALQVVTPSLSSTGDGIQTHYLFRILDREDGEKGAEVLTCSGSIFGGAPLLCKVEHEDDEERSFTVEGKRLKLWLGADLGDEALSFEFADSVVHVTSKRGKQKFQSLDPESFPYWDTVAAEAKLQATIGAKRLSKVLDHLKQFVSTDDTKMPQFCVTEIKEGTFYAADRISATVVAMEGMEEADVRVFGKNIPSLQSFLLSCGEGDVEIHGHDRFALYRRQDGAVFGESRTQVRFPFFDVSRDDVDQHAWMLAKKEIESGIKFVLAGAATDDVRLWFRATDDETVVEMGMSNTAGGETFLPVKCAEQSKQDDAEDLPEQGFAINYKDLLKVLSSHASGRNIRFGINQKGKGGWVRFDEEKDGDYYLSIAAWK